MFDSILIANRGEIACRVIRTARRLGIRTVAVYSEADADLPHVAEADEAVLLGGAAPTDSYLAMDKVLDAARKTAVAAVHPGYGFLSESAEFARAVEAVGLVWVGPPPAAIDAMGDKIRARNLMADAGVPVAPGTRDPLVDVDAAVRIARDIGYPLMVKASAGGGGIGMGVAEDEAALRQAFETARSRSERFFGNPELLLERYLPRARHVEVQILGLSDGRVIALGDRDCSVQRRHQKVAEESPSPGVTPQLRERLMDGAVRAGEAVGYRNAGTVECLVDPDTQEFVFLEMNTRLQVEHPVTEMVLGIDLVEQQLHIAAGEEITFDAAELKPSGHALELRIYAEDSKRFLPSPGRITTWRDPVGEGIRVDAGYWSGNSVTPFYDPLLAKLVVHGSDRDQALERARRAVEEFQIQGPKTNLEFFKELLQNSSFVSGDYDTRIVERMRSV
ncbi:acetyl-CoA carboxylase biotin carboxylase subunit [Blastococcus saxobsidens]|uniref:biotin carboxylase n=1 Tax=Blastococcus saxobsidens (strain DD2) TaxID=1146883 RepID=H6RNQ0_BLASD|nr:biotin carboxylase N-terminal domain-containing protein [Blastococcus saxobsidens]CCG05198.1 Pyruvate carboxylase [Blastococcus saxobsidens DD2]